MCRRAIQIAIGFGNKQITYQLDNKQQPLPIKNILNGLYDLFKEEDEAINKQIEEGVVTTKTGAPSEFSSEKILSSLIKIGIPIEMSVRTLEIAISKITEHIQKTKTLSTTDIRRIVAETIRKIEDVDDFEAQEWSYRYTRKYGHDSRRVEIYNHPLLGEVNVSYSVISDIIKDAFKKVIPEDAVKAISRAHMDSMCKYVIEFVNGCDLYYFDYETLLNMIIELSRQPPHPWLFTKDTAKLLKEYDIEAIKSNLQKLNSENVIDGETYCYSEIIHHSASLILQKYQWFLGTEDFSSFYILKNLIDKYVSADFMQLINVNNGIQKFERDLIMIDYSISDFIKLLEEIDYVIRSRRHPSEENRELLSKFGLLAVNIANNDSLNQLLHMVDDNWNAKTNTDKFAIINKILKIISHGSDCDIIYPVKSDNICRFVYNSTITINGRELKKQYIILYANDGCNNYEWLNLLNSRKYYEYSNVILVIGDNVSNDATINNINKATNDQYWIVPLNRENLKDLITNDNPAKVFYEVLRNTIA